MSYIVYSIAIEIKKSEIENAIRVITISLNIKESFASCTKLSIDKTCLNTMTKKTRDIKLTTRKNIFAKEENMSKPSNEFISTMFSY